MVTICTASLTFNNSTFCPHSVFMCFVWISEQTAIISLYNINWLVCITETECVYCAVRTGYLWFILNLIFKSSTEDSDKTKLTNLLQIMTCTGAFSGSIILSKIADLLFNFRTRAIYKHGQHKALSVPMHKAWPCCTTAAHMWLTVPIRHGLAARWHSLCYYF